MIDNQLEINIGTISSLEPSNIVTIYRVRFHLSCYIVSRCKSLILEQYPV